MLHTINHRQVSSRPRFALRTLGLLMLASVLVLLVMFQASTTATEASAAADESFGGAYVEKVISITPRIECSRDLGFAPMAVQVSAAGTSAEGCDHPYDQLAYRWDFGDADEQEQFDHPVTGERVNANQDQSGPEAAYVYRKPGEYKITLTARGGSHGKLISATTTFTVTVMPWQGQTRYFDPQDGNDGNDGHGADAPWKSAERLKVWLNGGDLRKARLRRGTTMTLPSRIFLKRSFIRVEPYGEGKPPVLLSKKIEDDQAMFIVWGNGRTLEDHVFQGLRFDGNNGAAKNLVRMLCIDVSGRLGMLRDMALVDCSFTGSRSSLVSIGGTREIDAVTIWNCQFDHGHGGGDALFAQLNRWLAVVGCRFAGGDGRINLDHHIYPSGVSNALFRWIRFQKVISKNFCINTNCRMDRIDTKYILIDGCDITGTMNGIDMSNGDNNPALGQFNDFICQNSRFHDLGGIQQGVGMWGACVKRLTVRDNAFSNNRQNDISIMDAQAQLLIYRNSFQRSRETVGASIVVQSGQQGSLTDNTFMSGAAFNSPDQATIALPKNELTRWHIDRNVYWTPNMSNEAGIVPFIDKSGNQRLTFKQWQRAGLDPNGAYRRPSDTN